MEMEMEMAFGASIALMTKARSHKLDNWHAIFGPGPLQKE